MAGVLCLLCTGTFVIFSLSNKNTALFLVHVEGWFLNLNFVTRCLQEELDVAGVP